MCKSEGSSCEASMHVSKSHDVRLAFTLRQLKQIAILQSSSFECNMAIYRTHIISLCKIVVESNSLPSKHPDAIVILAFVHLHSRKISSIGTSTSIFPVIPWTRRNSLKPESTTYAHLMTGSRHSQNSMSACFLAAIKVDVCLAVAFGCYSVAVIDSKNSQPWAATRQPTQTPEQGRVNSYSLSHGTSGTGVHLMGMLAKVVEMSHPAKQVIESQGEESQIQRSPAPWSPPHSLFMNKETMPSHESCFWVAQEICNITLFNAEEG